MPTTLVSGKRQVLLYGSILSVGLFLSLMAFKYSALAEDSLVNKEFAAVAQDRTAAFVIATAGLMHST